jgi:hypothetical protein
MIEIRTSSVQTEVRRMKQTRIFLWLAVLIFTVATLRQGPRSAVAASFPQAQQAQRSLPTIASIVDREITTIEKQIVEVAEARPEDKFNFSPESLNIPVSSLDGIPRTAGCGSRVAVHRGSVCNRRNPDGTMGHSDGCERGEVEGAGAGRRKIGSRAGPGL